MVFGTVLTHEGVLGIIKFDDGAVRKFDVFHNPPDSLIGCSIGVLQPNDTDLHRGEYGRLHEPYQPPRRNPYPTLEEPSLFDRFKSWLSQ